MQSVGGRSCVADALRANIDETESAAIITERGGQENHRERSQNAVPFVASSPDLEVPEKAQRRKFSAEDKNRILEDVDRTTGHGGIGAVLRRDLFLDVTRLAEGARCRCAQGVF